MGAVPPSIPGRGKEPFSWLGLWFAIAVVAIAALPAYGMVKMFTAIIADLYSR
jgi:hypothetical protein